VAKALAGSVFGSVRNHKANKAASPRTTTNPINLRVMCVFPNRYPDSLAAAPRKEKGRRVTAGRPLTS
jgi:hypothetical protein